MITPTFISSLFFIVFCSCSPFSSAQPGGQTPRFSGFSGPVRAIGFLRTLPGVLHSVSPCPEPLGFAPRPVRAIGFLRTLPGVLHSVSPCPKPLGFTPRPLRAYRLRPGAGPKRRSAGSIETSAADRIRDSDAPPTSRIAGNTKTDRHNILVMAVLSIRTERRRLAAPAGLRTVSVASGAPGSERQRRIPVVFCAHAGRYCRSSS